MSAQGVAAELLLEVELTISAELGRARMPLQSAVGLPGGTIVELDRMHDAPIDLYVNGRHFGTARLLIVDGEWAVRVESVDNLPAGPPVLTAVEAETVVQPSTEGQSAAPAADQTD